VSRAAAALLLLALLLAACRTPPPTPPPPAERPRAEDWRALVLAADRDRLDRLDAAWREGLAEARAGRFGAQLRALGSLLDAGAGLPRAAPPPGPYRCRMVRLGAGPSRAAFTLYPDFFCHVGVEGALLSFTKQTGSDLPGGYLFEDDDRRLIFLGGTARGADSLPPPYGADPERDVVGVVERIGPFRYRLAMPWPRSGAKLELLELVPVVAGG